MHAGPPCLGDILDVHLLPRRGGRYFLYSGQTEPDATAPPAALDSLSRKAATQVRRGCEWVSRRRRRRELLLKALGKMARVRIHHASSLSEADARLAYEALIRAAIDRHGRWMVISAAAVPASIPLSLIPGPNLLLAYLSWRSVVHYQSRRAGRRATSLPIEFTPEPALSRLADVVQKDRWLGRKRHIRTLGASLGLTDLDRVY